MSAAASPSVSARGTLGSRRRHREAAARVRRAAWRWCLTIAKDGGARLFDPGHPIRAKMLCCAAASRSRRLRQPGRCGWGAARASAVEPTATGSCTVRATACRAGGGPLCDAAISPQRHLVVPPAQVLPAWRCCRRSPRRAAVEPRHAQVGWLRDGQALTDESPVPMTFQKMG